MDSKFGSPMKVQSNVASTYRMVMYPDGVQELQEGRRWWCGALEEGITWVKMPVVLVDMEGNDL